MSSQAATMTHRLEMALSSLSTTRWHLVCAKAQAAGVPAHAAVSVERAYGQPGSDSRGDVLVWTWKAEI